MPSALVANAVPGSRRTSGHGPPPHDPGLASATGPSRDAMSQPIGNASREAVEATERVVAGAAHRASTVAGVIG